MIVLSLIIAAIPLKETSSVATKRKRAVEYPIGEEHEKIISVIFNYMLPCIYDSVFKR